MKKLIILPIVMLLFFLYPFKINAQLTQITNNEINEFYPRWSRDGTTISFTKWSSQLQGIWLVPGTGGAATAMNINLRGDFHTSWSPDGSKIAFDAYASNGLQIFTIPITGGNPEKLTNFGAAHPTWSPDGSKIAFTAGRSGNWDIWVMPATGGAATQLTTDTAEDWHALWSPDGSHIAFTSDRSGNNDIWTIPAGGGAATQITTNSAWDDSPTWSPDGSKIAFQSDRGGNFDIWTIELKNRTTEQVTFNESDDHSPDWSADGSKIVFVSQRYANNLNVWVIDIPTTNIENKEYALPGNFNLQQNYPNPFNANTTISFELDQSANITLQIYDILGKKIQTTQINDFFQEGFHSIKFDAGSLTSGIYFYKLNTNNGYSQIKKMCVLK